jgi:hypothetical protein
MRPLEWRPPSTVDGGRPTYSGTVTVSGQGDHTLTYWSVDNADNTEVANTTHIKLDNVAPATTIATTPAAPDGTNNWFKRASVTFTLAATDATSGVANRFYTVDGGGQQTYSGTVTISTQGDHTVTYWSVDNAGNTETANTTHIKLDNVAPANSLALTNKTGGSFVGGNTVYYRGAAVGSFSIQNTVSDATSGAASSTSPRSVERPRLDAHHARREDDALRRPIRLEPLQLERRHELLTDRGRDGADAAGNTTTRRR